MSLPIDGGTGGNGNAAAAVQAKSSSQYMVWMGHLQSHHTYRKHQLTHSAASDGKQPPHQQSSTDGHIGASPSGLFTGTLLQNTIQ